MPLNLDLAKPLRSLPRLEELVRAVLDAPASTQEQPFVEWKSEGDAADKKWRTELAKQVLGMANRDPDAAAAWLGGCGYVLVGVAPGVLNGSPVHDSAKIESWLAPYVGRTPDGPEWISNFPLVDGKEVLVLAIEPPKWGDAIWTCRKEFLADPKVPGWGPTVALREGAIYVRHKASTEEASASDLAMLQRRLLGSRRRIGGISIPLTPDSRASRLMRTPRQCPPGLSGSGRPSSRPHLRPRSRRQSRGPSTSMSCGLKARFTQRPRYWPASSRPCRPR